MKALINKDLLIDKFCSVKDNDFTELSCFLKRGSSSDKDKIINILSKNVMIKDFNYFIKGFGYKDIFYIIKKYYSNFEKPIQIIEYCSNIKYVPKHIIEFLLSKNNYSHSCHSRNRDSREFIQQTNAFIRNVYGQLNLDFVIEQLECVDRNEILCESFHNRRLRYVYNMRLELIKKVLDRHHYIFTNHFFSKKKDIIIDKINNFNWSFKLFFKRIPFLWDKKDLLTQIDEVGYDFLGTYITSSLIKIDTSILKTYIEYNVIYRFLQENISHIYIDKEDYETIDLLIKYFPDKYNEILLSQHIPHKKYIMKKKRSNLKRASLEDIFRYSKKNNTANMFLDFFNYKFHQQYKEYPRLSYRNLVDEVTKESPFNYKSIKEITNIHYKVKGDRLLRIWNKKGLEEYDCSQFYNIKSMPRRVRKKFLKDRVETDLRLDLLTMILLFAERGIDYNHLCNLLKNFNNKKILRLILNASFKLNNKQLIKLFKIAQSIPVNTMRRNSRLERRERILSDAIRMLRQLSYSPICLKVKNIKQFHDDLVMLYNEVKIKKDKNLNQTLELPKKVLKYKVVIPQTKKDLITHGRIFHNCVGSYARSIVTGKCNIIFLYKEDSPEMCLEIIGDKIVQIKKEYNKSVNKELRQQLENELFNKKAG